jgi:hypothetical protein
MATQPIGGLGGQFSGPTGWNLKFASWSGSYDIETADAQGFADAGFIFPIPINSGFSGAVAGVLQFDGTNTQPVPDALMDGSVLALGDFNTHAVGTITLTVTTGCTIAFTAVMTNFTVNRVLKGAAVLGSFSFVSQGPITIVWDESA